MSPHPCLRRPDLLHRTCRPAGRLIVADRGFCARRCPHAGCCTRLWCCVCVCCALHLRSLSRVLRHRQRCLSVCRRSIRAASRGALRLSHLDRIMIRLTDLHGCCRCERPGEIRAVAAAARRLRRA
ncbi:hypothetical protein FA09DRAFT_40607 [Tilletiopsis washingtonensis]|uniref:Uncharacterized protein n=1 Tax=Tilletiopsis washingtonensis TaxID=58919 RepID=A0A316Z7M5_9BASI|nr:hypothetical protein FA09DRAFT_40607 [Tilletiopsis washingtonensis]PWN97599.1 hypothetical protein FA09DRAFT_40607 [Tilletiopsis washingtonensis]